MNLLRIVRLAWTFYLGFLFISLAITACCAFLFWEYGLTMLAILCWLKIATLGMTFVFINRYKEKEYYYYRNLGVHKYLIWSCSLFVDLAIFFLLMFSISHFR